MISDAELDKFLAEHPEAQQEYERLLRSMRPRSRPRRKRLRDATLPGSEEYAAIPVEFYVPPVPDSFQGLEPGTSIWIRYWKAHPEQQEDMLMLTKERRVR